MAIKVPRFVSPGILQYCCFSSSAFHGIPIYCVAHALISGSASVGRAILAMMAYLHLMAVFLQGVSAHASLEDLVQFTPSSQCSVYCGASARSSTWLTCTFVGADAELGRFLMRDVEAEGGPSLRFCPLHDDHTLMLRYLWFPRHFDDRQARLDVS